MKKCIIVIIALFFSFLNANMVFAGTGDFNADGKPDIIWQNTSTGQTYYWLMDGLNLSSSGYLYDGNPVALEWQLRLK